MNLISRAIGRPPDSDAYLNHCADPNEMPEGIKHMALLKEARQETCFGLTINSAVIINEHFYICLTEGCKKKGVRIRQMRKDVFMS